MKAGVGVWRGPRGFVALGRQQPAQRHTGDVNVTGAHGFAMTLVMGKG